MHRVAQQIEMTQKFLISQVLLSDYFMLASPIETKRSYTTVNYATVVQLTVLSDYLIVTRWRIPPISRSKHEAEDILFITRGKFLLSGGNDLPNQRTKPA